MKISNNCFTVKNVDYKQSALRSSKAVAFTNAQQKPFNDINLGYALREARTQKQNLKLKNLERNITLKDFDLSKINGIQAGIPVFEGLTMKEVAIVLNNPSILLNRGCPNNCSHCGYMATPYSNKTLDKMSYEDFVKFIDGVSVLQKRMGSDVELLNLANLFLDSDCMELEISDKNGCLHDFNDLLTIAKTKGMKILFDTSGWPQKSLKHQVRAQRLVDTLCDKGGYNYLDTFQEFNISINPYHGLCARADELYSVHCKADADKLRNNYIDRMANVLFTFTPLLLNSNQQINISERYINNAWRENDKKKMLALHNDIMDRLAQMYLDDLRGDQNLVADEMMISEYLYLWEQCVCRDANVYPIGRAEDRCKQSFGTLAERKCETIADARKNVFDLSSAINPNGSVILYDGDISIPTDIQLNFENSGKHVKPFAHQVNSYRYSTTV